VFVAGAGGAVGTAVSRTLAAQGADLVLHGHGRSPALRDLADELHRRHGTRPLVVHGDITEPERIAEVRDTLRANACGALDGIVNCTTGFERPPGGTGRPVVKEFRRVVDVDLVGAYVLVHELLPLLTARPGARVVLFSRPGRANAVGPVPPTCAPRRRVCRGSRSGWPVTWRRTASRCTAGNRDRFGPHGPTGVPASTVEQVADLVAILASPVGDPLREQVLVLQGNP